MRLTIYNLIASILWSDVCILAFCLLRRRYAFIRDYGVVPLISILVVGCVRFFLPIELPYTVIVPSTSFLPALQDGLRVSFWGTMTYGLLMCLIWLGVSLVLIIRLLIGQLDQRSRIAYLLRADHTAAVQALAEIRPSNVKWDAVVIVSPDVKVPAVTGFIRPTFLLPEMNLTQQQLQCVLRHELGHFIGKDAWIKLAVAIFQAIFWWNPLVYMLEKDLSYLLEVRSDAYATKGFADDRKVEYVEAVAEVIRQTGLRGSRVPNYSLAISGTQDKDKLYERMQLVFSQKSRRKGGPKLLIALLAVMMIVSYSFVVQPQGYPPMEPGMIAVDKSNAYLESTNQGTYKLFVNGQYFQTLTKEDIQTSQLDELEIRNEN